jgi:hypothetical protein
VNGFAELMIETTKMRRLAGLSLVLLGAFVFVSWGFLLDQRSPNGSCDFEWVYYPSRILVMHQDPYARNINFLQLQNGGYLNPNTLTPPSELSLATVYPPTTLLLVAPLALLPWHYANLIWLSLLAASIIIAAVLVWSAAAEYAPVLTGFLICFTLVNSVTLLLEANTAGLAVGLSVIAMTLIGQQRFEIIAVLCLAMSICLKPHDGAFIWLFLLIAGPVFRTRAFQTVLVVVLLAFPATLWVSSVSPNWFHELAANVALYSSPGAVNDPGPTSPTDLITTSAVNLQTVFAVFANKPAFYNLASYITCAPLFVVLFLAATRQEGSSRHRWLGIAAIAAVAMLPVYHRHNDAKMLLLAIPACAMLWASNRVLGSISTAITFGALAMTGDIPRAVLQNLEQNHTFTTTTLAAKMQMVAFARPAPLALLAMAVFFVFLFARADHDRLHQAASRTAPNESAQLT